MKRPASLAIRMHPGLLAVALLCLARPAFACMQMGEAEYRRITLVDQVEDARLLGTTMETPPDHYAVAQTTSFTHGSWAQLEADAISLVFAGRYEEAIRQLQKAEAVQPGNYSVAANLGTTFELNGQNQSALRWINEALRRSPDSHGRTEWVHVLILEAKVRAETASAAGSGFRPLISLPDEFTEDTLVPIRGATYPVTEIKRSIHFQLRERMKFVKPRDPYVADLLFTLSRIDARLYGPESAYEYVKLAETYGYADAAALRADKRSYFKPVLIGRLLAAGSLFFKAVAAAALLYFILRWLVSFLLRHGIIRMRKTEPASPPASVS